VKNTPGCQPLIGVDSHADAQAVKQIAKHCPQDL
jgi:hypothetical protein